MKDSLNLTFLFTDIESSTSKWEEQTGLSLQIGTSEMDSYLDRVWVHRPADDMRRFAGPERTIRSP